MKEFDKYITISFDYDGCNYNHKIDKKEIEIHEDNNVWFSYFDFGKYHFEVWGGLDEDNNPITGGESKNNRCFKDESLDKDLFVEKYGRVMGEHYYNKFVHEFDGNILKMVGYFRGSEKEGQAFCDMITERIEKYEKRMSYDKGKLNN